MSVLSGNLRNLILVKSVDHSRKPIPSNEPQIDFKTVPKITDIKIRQQNFQTYKILIILMGYLFYCVLQNYRKSSAQEIHTNGLINIDEFRKSAGE